MGMEVHMRWVSLCVLFICLAVLPMSVSALCLTDYGWVNGDVNGDGLVNVADVQCELLVTFSSAPGAVLPACLRTFSGYSDTEPFRLAADFNCDEEINVSDVLIVNTLSLGNPLSSLIDADQDGCVDVCQSPCAGKAVGAPCSDMNPCTLSDTCTGSGACQGGHGYCGDGNSCTADSCNLISGVCINSVLADGESCDDGSACTEGDQCQSGQCVSEPRNCDDENRCTADSCNPVTGCINDATALNGTSCFDGEICLAGETCDQGVCLGTYTLGCYDYYPFVWDGCRWCGSQGNDLGNNSFVYDGPSVEAEVEQVSSATVSGYVVEGYNESFVYVTDAGAVHSVNEAFQDLFTPIQLQPSVPGTPIIASGAPALGAYYVVIALETPVLVGGYPSTIVGIRKSDWSLVWGYGGSPVSSGILMYGLNQLYVEYEQQAICLRVSTGQPCQGWNSEPLAECSLLGGKAPLVSSNLPTGSGDPNKIFQLVFPCSNGWIYAIDYETGDLQWTGGPSETLGYEVQTSAGAFISRGGYLNVPDDTGQYWVYHLETGQQVSDRDIFGDGSWFAQQAVAQPLRQASQNYSLNPVMLVATENYLIEMNPSLDGLTAYWFEEPITAGPVMDGNERAYLVSDGVLYLYDLVSGTFVSLATGIDAERMTLGINKIYLSGSTAGGVHVIGDDI